MSSEVRLLRHGETAGYAGDLGLSDRGREQARAAAAGLAAEAPGTVVVRHAPSVRAAVTAELLAADLLAAGVSVGDPIALWLTTPLLGFEPPAVAGPPLPELRKG